MFYGYCINFRLNTSTIALGLFRGKKNCFTIPAAGEIMEKVISNGEC